MSSTALGTVDRGLDPLARGQVAGHDDHRALCGQQQGR
jgi:hypothetical protein